MATVNFDAPTTGWVEIEATDAAIRQAFVSVGSDAAVRVQVGTSLPAASNDDGIVLFSGMPSANITIEAGEAIYAKGVSRTARIAIEVNTLAGSDPSKGWADYADSLRTTGSPQAVPANTDTVVLNDGVNGVKSQEPAGIDFYSGGVITGRNGDGLMITTEFKIRRASGNGDYSLEYWWDIGGAVGELYRRTFNLPGTGERNITFTTGVYTLDTWEANGATSYIRTSVATEIHSVRYVIHRTHIGA